MEADKYYELKVSGRQVQLRVRPPEGGRKASLSDIQKELRRREVDYRHETLFDIYRRASDEFETLAVQEAKAWEVFVEVSEDAQQAVLTVIPPEVGEDTLTPARIKKALEAVKVEKGIRYDEIKRILAEHRLAEGVPIAQGSPRQHGRDGRIEFVEKPGNDAWLGENTADFRELNLIDNVKEGAEVARIHPPTPGQDGFDVHARILRARPGKKARFKLGRNVRLGEEGKVLYAAKDGYVVRSGARISVENILEVNNVDAETGNIRFHGVVRVHGQVDDNFLVEAEKGIEVAGTVGHSRLVTKGDLRVHGGAIGAELEAEGNVTARFLSESKVRAGLNVLVEEYILHSEVEAKRAVKVIREPEGFIQGGRIKAGTEIWTSVLGSQASEERTALEVGGGVNVRQRFDTLAERIAANLDAFEKMRKNLLYLQQQREQEGPPEGRRKETYEQNLASARKLCEELNRQGRLHQDFLEQLAHPAEEGGMVFVSQTAHPGALVQIQTQRVQLRDAMESCAFVALAGGLKAMPYGTALKLHKQQQMKKPKLTT